MLNKKLTRSTRLSFAFMESGKERLCLHESSNEFDELITTDDFNFFLVEETRDWSFINNPVSFSESVALITINTDLIRDR